MADTPKDFPAASISPNEPPEVREARIESHTRITIWTALISSLTDWLGIGCLTYLIAMKALDGAQFGWGIVALAGGTAYAKARSAMGGPGKGGSTTALVLAGGPVAWKAAAAILGRQVLALGLAAWLTGCAGQGRQLDIADPIAVARRAERVAPEMASELIALCVPKPADPATAAHCKRLGMLFDYLVSAKGEP